MKDNFYSYPVTVEFEDIDSYGIIHHPKLLYYMERARMHYFFDNGLDLKKINFGLAVRNATISFKQPLFLMDKVIVELRSENISKFRFNFDFTVKKLDKIAITATLELIAIDLSMKKLIPLPGELLEQLKKIEITV